MSIDPNYESFVPTTAEVDPLAPPSPTASTAPLEQAAVKPKEPAPTCPCCQSMPASVIGPVVNNLALTLEQAIKQRMQTAQAAPAPAPAPVASAPSLASAGLDPKYAGILGLISERVDHRLFFESNNLDPVLNAANSVQVSGGDLSLFLDTVSRVGARGGDVDKFCQVARQVALKGDYDDIRRFLNVTQTVLQCDAQALNDYLRIADEALDEYPADFEGIVFQCHTALRYGASVADFEAIWRGMPLNGFEGDNNGVDLTRVLVDIRQRGGSEGAFLKMMAQSGDGRRLLDEYMALYGLPSTCPDRSQFVQIQRMDEKEPMVISQGEKSALFCQAISDYHGLLPETSVYWSSPELGAVDQGWTLELDQLPPGTYHFYAKIGNYPATDTAVRTVVVEPKGDHDRGHGNDPGQYDADNPGQGRRILPHASDVTTDFSGVFQRKATPDLMGWKRSEPEVRAIAEVVSAPATPLDEVIAQMQASHDKVVRDLVDILGPFRSRFGDEAARDQLKQELEAYLAFIASLR